MKYVGTIEIPADLPLGMLSAVFDVVNGVGMATIDNLMRDGILRFEVEAEDEWTLRDILAGLEQEVAAYQCSLDVDRANVVASNS